MSSERRSPWWPYLLVLAGLFVLSVAVPRRWQVAKIDHRPSNPAHHNVAMQPKPMPVRPVIVPPMPESKSAVAHQTDQQPVDRHIPPLPPTAGLPTVATHADPVDEFAAVKPWTELVSQKIADARRFLAEQREAKAAIQPSSSQSLVGAHTDAACDGESRLASVLIRRTLTSGQLLAIPAVTWPLPESLLHQLERLSQSLECREWAIAAKELCESLAATPIDETRDSLAIVAQLQTVTAQADGVAGEVHDPYAAAELRRAQYALQRRLLAWELTAKAGDHGTTFANVLSGDERRTKLVNTAAGVRTYLDTIAHGDAWAKYLALDEIARLASAGSSASSDEVRISARRILNLLSPVEATPAQRRVLGDQTVRSLAEQLHGLASEPTDNRELLVNIERYETSRRSSDAVALVEIQQRLNWSGDATDRELASHIENHYRNANIRAALSKELLQRLAPPPMTTYDQVAEVIVGASVQGQSVNTIEFQVKLIPDTRRIHLWLEACGMVFSRTQSSSGPATMNNRGSAHFIVRKAVLLDQQGLGVGQASTEADTRSQLVGVRTNFDGIPLVGPMVRNYAASQYDEMREQARWESREKVAARAGERVNLEVNKRLQDVEDRVRREILGPLANLGLDLDPISMETAAERATLRLRLAGLHQLGSHTARPQAPSDSLASVQIHESALNNALDQLQLSGRSFELPELYRHLAKRLSRPEPRLPADLPDGVQITFADLDPVRIRGDEDKLRLTMAIKELRQGSRSWHDFEISTTYKPEVYGRIVKLARDGIIDLDGEAYKGKAEFALRGIFSKILSREKTLNLVPPAIVEHPRMADLCITQCTIEDGWLGIALGPDRTIVRSDEAKHLIPQILRK
ncbi:MAG: hypothetical protein IT427_20525 [Pirellulales bacterium]|nr:hypothetical protein [Pirellulales bacterium]